ncbi:hypothetical protein Emed_001756 [Eimeria media]
MLSVPGAPPRRLQAGINIDAQEKAQKGFIIIWMSITLIFVVILGVWFTIKIADQQLQQQQKQQQRQQQQQEA